jgi:pimeloyl-ACP methyl ester carboxylesterase
MTPLPRPSTVVLLHSSGSNSRQWDALADALRPTCRVLTVDFHGHGLRPARPGIAGSSLAHDAALVEPLLADTDGVHLIGHSYGGAVAFKLAAEHPRRVRSLAVFEPVMFRLLIEDDVISAPARELFEMVDALTAFLADDEPLEAARRFVEYWSGLQAWFDMPAGRQRSVAARMSTVLGHFHGLFAEPSPQRLLERVSMPTLCLTGGDTVASTRRIGELLAELLGRAQHETLPGMGHMGPLTHAEQVNRRLLAFLDAQRTREALEPRECMAA